MTETDKTTRPADSIPNVSGTVDRLRRTFESGRTRSIDWRSNQLRALARLLDDQEDALTRALVDDLRRSPFEAAMFDLVPTNAEVKHARKNLAGWMKRRRVSTGLSGMPGKAWYQYEPLGVSVIIAPWNYPIHLSLTPLIGAIAAGCCAVIKPSELTPASSALLAELIPRYLDSDAFVVIEGAAPETLDLIDQAPDHVFFTGSPAVGAAVMAAAAPHLIPVTLELGGKCPAIITDSANVEVAARRIAFGKLVNSGQTCVAPDYVLVDKSLRRPFIDAIRTTMSEFSDGRRMPIINQRHSQRLADLLADGGGTTELGGAIDVAAAEAEPTVITDPIPGSTLVTDEIFGPLLPVLTVDSLGDAITHINAGTRPLASYLFSERTSDEERFLAEVTTGATVINHVMLHLSVPELPFGGVGTSGIGTYHGEWGFQTFSHPKAVLRKPTGFDPKFIYPPYSKRVQNFMRRMM